MGESSLTDLRKTVNFASDLRNFRNFFFFKNTVRVRSMFLASLLDRSFAASGFRFARHAIGGTLVHP